MAGKPGARSLLPTELPARYSRHFAWKLHGSCELARRIASDLAEQWTALGGVGGLSPQELTIVERIVFLRRRVLAYESALMHNESRRPDQAELPLPFDAGVYTNHVNLMLGLIKTIGTERRARATNGVQAYLAKVGGSHG